MSFHYMIHGEPEVRVYDDGRTKQSFKNSTDINKILGAYAKTGVISHLNKFEPQYGDYEGFDFFEAQLVINNGEAIFAALPSEIRREFDQDPTKFFKFVNDPDNKDTLEKIFPDLAKKGDYFPDVSSDTPPGELAQGGEPGGAEVKVEEPAKED